LWEKSPCSGPFVTPYLTCVTSWWPNGAPDSLICRSVLTGPHPSYPNPTIIQVTCEIAFATEAELKLSAAILYPIFGSEFPEIQPVPTSLQVMIGQPQPAQDPSLSANAGAFRFATEDGKRFVQLSKTNFVYQSNESYPGWEAFRTKLMELWSSALPRIERSAITKIGLRYINRIVRTKTHPSPGDWLQPTSDIPASLLKSHGHFMGRVESSPRSSHLRLVTVAGEAPGPDWPQGTIIMDIDRINTESFKADSKAILKNLEFLHDDVWTCFDSAGTKNLKKSLTRKTK
jgi:uncharacterized protein (TIGR04255 family)